MKIIYRNGVSAWEDFKEQVYQFIVQEKYTAIAEIGGGANPLLSFDFLKKQKLNYHVIDVSAEELSKADNRYEKKVINLEEPVTVVAMHYDFIFAQMTLEHIKEAQTFYENVYKLLKPNGSAFFFFACATSLPSLTNLVVPNAVSERLLLSLQPFRSNEKHGKFKAYYKWCFGPTQININRFKRVGFKVTCYTGYFGHSYYQKFKLLNFLEQLKTRFLLKNPTPYLCSYAHLLIKKAPNP